MTPYVLSALGLALLLGGGELLLRGSVGLAQVLGVSKLLIGLVVVSIATSMPELLVSVGAGLRGSPDIAVGNVVGSNIANILLVLGIAAVVTPWRMAPKAVVHDAWMLLGSALILVALALAGGIGRLVGVLLVVTLVAYIWFSYAKEGRSPVEREIHEDQAEEIEEQSPRALWVAAAFLIAGLVLLAVGAQSLLTGAVSLARGLGVPEAVIGLTLVAIGTSLPEVATSVVASLRGHADVAIGNAIGSCIFNILAILGLTAVVKPIQIAGSIATTDVWVMLAVTAGAAFVLLRGIRAGRAFGAVAIGGYVLYVVLLFV